MPEDQKASNFANNSLVLAALISLSGLVVANFTSLQGERPPAGVAQLHETVSAQDIDARLWQDPFAVVALANEKDEVVSRKAEPRLCPDKGKVNHCDKPLGQLRPLGSGPLSGVSTLWVTMSGAPYFAEEEERRRFRYAVVSALNVCGFTPANATHLGYYVPETFRQSRIPFEFFESERETCGAANQENAAQKTKSETSVSRKILVAWVNEDVLGERPGPALEDLARDMGNPDAIIGPQQSGILNGLMENLSSDENKNKKSLIGATPFYAYGATAPDYNNNNAPNIFRVVATDDKVADALVEELDRRGVDPCNDNQQILTLSEFDTNYGRSLKEIFRRALSRKCPNPRVLHKAYLRGLDGEQADTKTKTDSKGKESGSASADKNDARDNSDDAKVDKPLGSTQRDYLRRLVTDLKREQGESRFTAIGVLGSDVFDKLMILRALRSEFPETVFFTTDYDAAFGLKNELQFTRNIIVASSFGRELQPGLQGDIPPFRDSYETSAFLATQIAIKRGSALSMVSEPVSIQDAVGKLLDGAKEGEDPSGSNSRVNPEWPPSPRLFEVTRDGDFLELSREVTAHAPSVQPKPKPVYPASAYWLLSPAVLCLVYALASFWVAWPEKKRGILAALAFLVLFCIFIAGLWAAPASVLSWLSFAGFVFAGGVWLGRHDALRSQFIAMFWPAMAFLFSAGVFVGAFSNSFWTLSLLEAVTEHGLGEPVSLIRGVSVWPALGLRLFALPLAVWLILRAFDRLDGNFNRICEEFGFAGPGWRPLDIVRDHSKTIRIYPWLNPTYFYRVPPARDGKFEITEDEWKRIVLNSWSPHRIARILLWIIFIAVPFLFFLFSAFGQPFDPSRGAVFRYFYRGVTILNVIAMWFLLFLVIDATLFLGLLVWRLSHSQTKWPDSVVKTFKKKLGLTYELNDYQIEIINDWIDIQYIAKRTRCINPLVWYPFFIISTMIVSRSGLFSNFPLSWPIVIVQGFGLFLLFACAFALNWFAEEQRKRAQRHLRAEITRQRNAEVDRSKTWEDLLDRVTNLNQGSFRNFMQQPVFAGMLLPLASVGGPQFIEQMHLFGR